MALHPCLRTCTKQTVNVEPIFSAGAVRDAPALRGRWMSSDPFWWALESSHARGSTRLVVLALAASTNYRRCIAFPSHSRLARLTLLSRSQVYFHLRKLVAMGEIVPVGFDPASGERVYHLVQFCDHGKQNTVRFPGFSCPQTLSYQQHHKTVRETAYVEQKERNGVRESGPSTTDARKARDSYGDRFGATRRTGALPAVAGKYDRIKPVIVRT